MLRIQSFLDLECVQDQAERGRRDKASTNQAVDHSIITHSNMRDTACDLLNFDVDDVKIGIQEVVR